MFWRCFCYVLFNGFSLPLCVSADCSPVQFDASLLLQLSPQLIALLHHAGVEVMVVGLADDAGLAMGAATAVGQDELGEEKLNLIPAVCTSSFIVFVRITTYD